MWWKIEEVPHQELEEWASAVYSCERRAKRDPATRAAGVFVIYSLPDGAYLVERWVRGKRGWTLYE